jgi:hypothetical protein
MATRGDVTEAAVLWQFTKHGLTVLLPFRQDLPYDLVVARRDGSFLRVQCKAGRLREGCVVFNSASTDHGRGRLHYRGRADVFAVFCPEIDGVFVVPVEDAADFVTSLRVTPTRNGQRRRTRPAADYALDRWAAEDVDRRGVVAV